MYAVSKTALETPARPSPKAKPVLCISVRVAGSSTLAKAAFSSSVPTSM